MLLIERKRNRVVSNMYRLSRRFRRRFGKDREEKKDKHALDYVIVLLDGSDLSFNLHVSLIIILIQ